MTLKELLSRYAKPEDAAKEARLGRTAGYAWYRTDNPLVPSNKALVNMAFAQGLTEIELGKILVNAARERASR